MVCLLSKDCPRKRAVTERSFALWKLMLSKVRRLSGVKIGGFLLKVLPVVFVILLAV